MGKRFIPPSPAEATAYATTIGYKFDGEDFCDFYQSKGWKVGTTPMADWRAAIRTWKRRTQKDQAGLARPMVDNRRRLAEIDQKYIIEYTGQLAALRSWRGKPNCPLGDVANAERRLLSKIRDTHGPQLVARVLAKCKEDRPC